MTNKILKKIAGAFNYKLVEKNLVKNNRLINSKSILNLNLILKKIFDSQKIECLIQIGANDGNWFDELNKFIKEYAHDQSHTLKETSAHTYADHWASSLVLEEQRHSDRVGSQQNYSFAHS